MEDTAKVNETTIVEYETEILLLKAQVAFAD